MRSFNPLLLKVWHALDTSTTPQKLENETDTDFRTRYDNWLETHKQTARLIEYLGHAGIQLNRKMEFMGDWL